MRSDPLWAVAAVCIALFSPGCGKDPGAALPPIEAEEARVGRRGLWWSPPSDFRPPNLVLVTLDTTRRDALSCYGAPAGSTPNLDRLAAEGVVFDRAVTPVPVTLPAHASILTGLFPYQHGVRNNGTYALDDRHLTAAEALKSRGYATAAVVGAFPVDHRFGLGQGFDHYDDDLPLASIRRESDTAQRPAGEVTRLGLEWLDTVSEHPFFLWLHYFDPHAPYAPPEPFGTRHPESPYAGEVAYMDDAIGAFLAGLADRELLAGTAILVAGDHGESLGEHGESTHSIFVYNATQRVPLLLRPPEDPLWDGLRGRRSSALASLVDCFPTLLNLAGLRGEDRPLCSGRSLLPVARGDDPGHAWVYLESLVGRLEYGWSDLRALETDRWKFIRAPRSELYEPVKDPGEAENLCERAPGVRRVLEEGLARVLAADVGDESFRVTLDEETLERLRSLGYMAGAETPAADGAGPDPKEMIASYEQVNAARSLVAAHRPSDALALVDTVLAGNPRDATARRIRASCLVRLGRGEEAIGEYDRLLRECVGCPDQADLLEGRAMAALAAGRLDDARERSVALLAGSRPRPAIRLLLARIEAAAGDTAAALRSLDAAIRQDPTQTDALLVLAELEAARGRSAASGRALRRALAASPNRADLLAAMAEVLVQRGEIDSARTFVTAALAADPHEPQALFRQGWLLRRDGRTDDAVRAYEQALRLTPDQTALLYNLGNLYMETGVLDRAAKLYERAVELGLAEQSLFVNLGVLRAQKNDLRGAVAWWERAVAADPTSPQVEGIRNNLERARAMLGQGAGR